MTLFKSGKYTLDIEKIAGLTRYEITVPQPESGVQVVFNGGGHMRIADPAGLQLEARLTEIDREIAF